MNSFIDATLEDSERVIKRAARACYVKKEISEESFKKVVRIMSELEEVLKEIEDVD